MQFILEAIGYLVFLLIMGLTEVEALEKVSNKYKVCKDALKRYMNSRAEDAKKG